MRTAGLSGSRLKGKYMPTAPPLDGGPFVATRHCQTYQHDVTPEEKLPSPLAQLAATCRIKNALGRRVAAFV
jgi:hypothetical protein